MHIQELLTAAIVAIPTAFFALSIAQFVATRAMTGKRPIAPVTTPLSVREPQQLNSEPIAAAVQMEPQQQGQEVPVSVPGDALVVMPRAMDSAQAEVASGETEPAQSVCEIDVVIIPEVLYHKSHTHFEVGRSQPIALLPAFIPNQNQPDYSDADRHLVEDSIDSIAQYWQAVPTDNVVPFTRPVTATQKPQQAHPAIEGMTLRAMRQLGADLRIKNARRWNTQQAIDALSEHFRKGVQAA